MKWVEAIDLRIWKAPRKYAFTLVELLNYFAASSRILMFRNQHSSPWSVSKMWPLIFSPKPGAFLNLLLATAAFNASLPNSYSRTFFPFNQCST